MFSPSSSIRSVVTVRSSPPSFGASSLSPLPCPMTPSVASLLLPPPWCPSRPFQSVVSWISRRVLGRLRQLSVPKSLTSLDGQVCVWGEGGGEGEWGEGGGGRGEEGGEVVLLCCSRLIKLSKIGFCCTLGNIPNISFHPGLSRVFFLDAQVCDFLHEFHTRHLELDVRLPPTGLRSRSPTSTPKTVIRASSDKLQVCVSLHTDGTSLCGRQSHQLLRLRPCNATSSKKPRALSCRRIDWGFQDPCEKSTLFISASAQCAPTSSIVNVSNQLPSRFALSRTLVFIRL